MRLSFVFVPLSPSPSFAPALFARLFFQPYRFVVVAALATYQVVSFALACVFSFSVVMNGRAIVGLVEQKAHLSILCRGFYTLGVLRFLEGGGEG